jgi:hypothetical protein
VLRVSRSKRSSEEISFTHPVVDSRKTVATAGRRRIRNLDGAGLNGWGT